MGQPGKDTMSGLKTMIKKWADDKLLVSVIRNAGYLGSSNTLIMVLSAFKGILVSYLGAVEYGSLNIVILFASNVNKLLSFRMGEFVIRYTGGYLAHKDKKRAGASIKLAFIAETITSIFAFILLTILAPTAERLLLKNTIPVEWIIFFGVSLLANSITESSTAVMQLSNHYKKIAAVGLTQNIIATVWIVLAFVFNSGMFAVLMGYWVGKIINGLCMSFFALLELSSLIGKQWWREPLSILDNKREIMRFSFSTNISGTLSLIIRDSESLWAGYFFATSYQAGIYAFAFNIVSVVLMPVSQFHMATFPQINQYISTSAWGPLRNLLKKTTTIVFVWIALCAGGFALLGRWVLSFYKNGEYLASYPLVLILFIGFGFLNILFWNRNVLLSFSRQNYPLYSYALFGVIRILLMFLLVPKVGVIMQAILFSSFFAFSITFNALEGLKEIKKREKLVETV